MPKSSHARRKGGLKPPEFPQAGLVPGAAVSIPRNSWEFGATTTQCPRDTHGFNRNSALRCQVHSFSALSTASAGAAGTGCFAILGAANSPRRSGVIQDEGRRKVVFYTISASASERTVTSICGKCRRRFPFPTQLAESRAQSRSIAGAYHRSKASGLLGDKTTATRPPIRSSPQVITATLGSLGASSRSQWLERKRKCERFVPSSRGRSGVLFLRHVSPSRRCARRS